MSKDFKWEDSDFEDKKYDALSNPVELLQHHGDVSPGFYNLSHGDKSYDMSDAGSRMEGPYAMLRSMTDHDLARQAGRTSPSAEKAVGALGTSPKKPKAKKKVAAKSKKESKKGGKRKSRRKRKRKSRKKRKRGGEIDQCTMFTCPCPYNDGKCRDERAGSPVSYCIYAEEKYNEKNDNKWKKRATKAKCDWVSKMPTTTAVPVVSATAVTSSLKGKKYNPYAHLYTTSRRPSDGKRVAAIGGRRRKKSRKKRKKRRKRKTRR